MITFLDKYNFLNKYNYMILLQQFTKRVVWRQIKLLFSWFITWKVFSVSVLFPKTCTYEYCEKRIEEWMAQCARVIFSPNDKVCKWQGSHISHTM